MFIVYGRCQIVSSMASGKSVKNLLPATTSLSIASADRKVRVLVPLFFKAHSNCLAGSSSLTLSFSWAASRWSNCCTAVINFQVQDVQISRDPLVLPADDIGCFS